MSKATVTEVAEESVIIGGEKWLSLEGAARVLACHVNTVRAWIRCDRLPAKRMRENRWWIREADLARWLSTPDNRCPPLTNTDNR